MAGLDLLEVVGPAIVAGLMIALVHAPLGIEVLRRGIVFIDLAVAQAAALGVVMVGLVMPHPPGWLLQIAALACALLAAGLFRLVERRLPDQQEAIIGSAFVVLATLALLLLANRPHGGEELQSLLSGQILFVSWSQVIGFAPVYGVILLLWLKTPGVRSGSAFFVIFALTVTTSVQLVGVYVVFASLILPALTVCRLAPGRRLPLAWASGTTAVLAGIALSIPLDLPTGPMLVMAYATTAVVGRLLAPYSVSVPRPLT